MAKTINRTPSFFDSQKLDEKYSNLNTFAGICGNKNYLGIDQTTFEDANNMYIDQDAQLSSRPPIKQVAFVNGVIIKIYKINSLVVYHTLDADKYYIHFKFEENWHSREVTEKINITWWDKRYVVFTEDEIIGFTYDYYIDTITWYDTEAMIYVPITELISGSVKTANESENVLTKQKISRYIFRQDVVSIVTDLIGKDVVIEMDGEKYTITFAQNNDKVFVKAVGIFDVVELQSSELGNYLAFNDAGEMYYSTTGGLFYPITRPDGIKPFMSEDGTTLYSIKTENDSSIGTIYRMSLNITSPSQIPLLTWEETSFNILFSNFNSNHWASKTGYWTDNVPGTMYHRYMSSMQFTDIIFRYELNSAGTGTHGFETFGSSNEDGQAIFVASFEATVNCVNNIGQGFELGYDWTLDDTIYWGSGDYINGGTLITVSGRMFVLLLDGNITIYPIDYISGVIRSIPINLPSNKVKFASVLTRDNVPLNTICLTRTGSVQTSPGVYSPGIEFNGVIVLNGTVPFYNFSYDDQYGDKGLYYIIYKNSLRPSFGISFYIRSNPLLKEIENKDAFDIYSKFLPDDNTHVVKLAYNNNTTTSSTGPWNDVIKSARGYYQLETDYSANYYKSIYYYSPNSTADVPERETGTPVIVRLIPSTSNNYVDNMESSELNTSYTKFKLSDMSCLTNKYYRLRKQNIPLLTSSENNLPIYVDNDRIAYYDMDSHKIYDSSAWTEVYVDLTNNEENNIFVPYVFGTFVTNIVGYKNKAYISTLRDGQIYLPVNNELSFSDEVTNFAVFSQTSLGIFSENEVYELQYDEGLYRLSLTKLQLGCKKDSDILLNYDGKTIFLTTLKGLNALNYQDFVQSTEYVYNYLTENIMSMYDQYAKSPIKLYQFKNWVFMYRQDVNYLFLFDLRNSSWWKWTNVANIKQILFDGDKLLLVINGDLFEYDFNATEYIDDVGQRIDWMFKSQKLHFGAPNNYKHIKSVSIITPQDEETTLRYKMEFRNYRDLSNLSETDVFERDVDLLSTVIKKVNFIKTNAFQFTVMNDIKNPFPKKFLTPNIAIKYRITERLR